MESIKKADDIEYIHSIQLVYKTSVMNYSFGEKRAFFKINLGMPPFVKPLRTILEQGLSIPNLGYRKFLTYESNILFVLRCMIDSSITGSNWLEIKHGNFKLRPKEERQSHCQIEFDVMNENIITHDAVGDWSKGIQTFKNSCTYSYIKF
jgi:DNA polymerase delta subunit 1